MILSSPTPVSPLPPATVIVPASQTLIDGATISLDASQAEIAKVTLAGNRTLENPTGMVGGQRLLLIVTQDAVGGRTLAYGSAFAFPGDTPVINPTAGAKTVLEFIFDAESAVWRLIATTALSSVQRMEVATIGAGIDTSAAVAVGAEYNGCKVVCSLKTNAGIINAAPVLFRGVVAGGNLTVSCVDTVTGLLSNVTAGVTVDCVLGF